MDERKHTIGGSAKLLPLMQAADYIGVPYRTFEKNWRGWGLVAYRYGRRYHFRIRDLEHWLDQRRA